MQKGFVKKSMAEYRMDEALSIHALMQAYEEDGGSWSHFREYITRKTKPEFNFGTAAHRAIESLPAFKAEYMVKVLKKNDAAEYARQKEAVALGETQLITQDAYDRVMGIVDALNQPRNKFAYDLLNTGEKEMSGYCENPDLGFWEKIRPDNFDINTCIVTDFKTKGRRMTPHAQQKMMHDLKYPWQADFYERVLFNITGKKFTTWHVYAEDQAPFTISWGKMDPSSLELAAKKYYPLLPEYAQCLKTGIWPGPSTESQTYFSPGYAFGDGLE